jgi:hypothetical protein
MDKGFFLESDRGFYWQIKKKFPAQVLYSYVHLYKYIYVQNAVCSLPLVSGLIQAYQLIDQVLLNSVIGGIDMLKNFLLQCKENPIYVFLFWELRGFSANFHIHVCKLYIPRISPHISLQQNRQTDPGNI